DVLNVAEHRLGTSEIESALVSHPRVAEAAVVSRPDELKGQGVVAFVTLKTASIPRAGCMRNCAITSAYTSAQSQSRTKFASPKHCQRHGAAKSCDGFSKRSQVAQRSPATQLHWKISASWQC